MSRNRRTIENRLILKLIGKDFFFHGNRTHTFISKVKFHCWFLRGMQLLNKIVLSKDQPRKGHLPETLVPTPFVNCDSIETLVL